MKRNQQLMSKKIQTLMFKCMHQLTESLMETWDYSDCLGNMLDSHGRLLTGMEHVLSVGWAENMVVGSREVDVY